MKLPTTIKVNLASTDDGYEIFKDICEYVSDFITEKTGFCHKGFTIDVRVTASDIDYDIDEDEFDCSGENPPRLCCDCPHEDECRGE